MQPTRTNTHTYHGGFQQALTALGIEGSSTADRFNGLLTFHPELHSADGRPGLYSMWISRQAPFAVNDLFYTLFAANMPMLEDDFAFHVREQLQLAYRDMPLYEESRIHLLLDRDVAPEGDFIPMNKAEGYGMLRTMDLEDSLIYEALPNELSRVAGIITTVAQTPSLLHRRALRQSGHRSPSDSSGPRTRAADGSGSGRHLATSYRGRVARASRSAT